MPDAVAVGQEWEVRGRRAWLRALGVLDPAPDPALDAVAALAARTTGHPVTVHLRDGSSTLRVAPSGTDTEPGPDAAPVELVGLVVGEVRGTDPGGTTLAHTAACVHDVLTRRLARCREDEGGRPVAVVLVDAMATVLWVSPGTEDLFGHRGADWLGRSALELLEPATAEAATGVFVTAVASPGRAGYMPQRILVGDGGYRTFEVQTDNMLFDPEIGGLALIARASPDPEDEHSALGDQIWVLNRLAAGVPLADVLARVAELAERRDGASHACITRVADDGRTLHPVFAKRIPPPVLAALEGIEVGAGAPGGAAAVHFAQPTFSGHFEEEQWAGLRGPLTAHGYRACWSVPIASLAGAGQLGSLDVYRTVAGMPTAEDTRVLIVAARLASVAMDNERSSRDLRFSATHDSLTGLPNRALLSEHLAALGGPAALVVVGLDRLALVADTLGHEVGDDLLREVAQRAGSVLGGAEVVARIGDDALAALLAGATAGDAATAAARLLDALQAPYQLGGERVTIGASAGTAVTDGPPTDGEALVRQANAALHHARSGGGGRVVPFATSMLSAITDRLEVESALRAALEQGHLTVAFQPEVRIDGNVPVGVECLARCRAPDGRPVSPATFIPVAEEVGLIGQVFDAVLAQACGLARSWVPASPPPVLWVNLAPRQLGRPGLVRHVAAALESWELDPSVLGIEVTERGILPDPTEAVRRLREFVALGVRVAVDDFGTGYSSLGYLQELPADTVKLDASFVARAVHDVRSRAIIRAVVDLAAAIGLTCVAEGVETLSQLQIMRDLGCEVVQGYVYTAPLDQEDLRAWLAGPHRPADGGPGEGH